MDSAVSAATEQVEEKAQEAGTEAVDKAVDETKAAVDETMKMKPKKPAIEGC